jgi:hypothetical protein
MWMSRVFVLAAVAAGCGSGSITVHGQDGPDGAIDTPDAPPGTPDAEPGTPDAPPGTPDARPPDHPADAAVPPTTRLRVINRCSEPIWMAHNDRPGVDEQNIRLAQGELHDYAIPAAGVGSVRFWPKLGCDGSGHSCRIGDTGEGGGAPCNGGCQPPIDSKFEISFAPENGSEITFYNLSLVDGYTLPFTVRPLGTGAETGSCVTSDCSGLVLDACPQHETLGGGSFPAFNDVDLRAHNPANAGQIIGCMSPCKRWNYSPPFGLSQPESQDPGLHMCCPTPIDPGTGNCTAANGCISPDQCRATSDPVSVNHTDYVAAIHSLCPSAYSYSYDDVQGLHACPAKAQFEVTFCP